MICSVAGSSSSEQDFELIVQQVGIRGYLLVAN
jgi:hypothetical protein